MKRVHGFKGSREKQFRVQSSESEIKNEDKKL